MSVLPDPSLAASTMRTDPGSPPSPLPVQEENEEDEQVQNEEELQEGSQEDVDAQQSAEPQQLSRTPGEADAVAQKSAAAGSSSELEFDYEWKDLPPDMVAPPGMEYQKSMDGGPNRARIPSKWQLQLWSAAADAFYRVEVTRFQTIADVEAALERTGPSLPRSMQRDWGAVRLATRGFVLQRRLTVEQARLFQLKEEKQLELMTL